MSWLLSHYDEVLELLGALSIAAALFAKLTPNSKDDEVVGKVKKVLDFVSLSLRKQKE